MPGVEGGHLHQIQLPRSVVKDAFAGLHQMNITHATLFPGLDGYARRLRQRVGFLHGSKAFFDKTIY